jgi:hypothetical protein
MEVPLPYAHSVHRVTISGTAFDAAEIWSTGFYLGSAGAGVSNPTQPLADAIRTAWTAFFTDTAMSFGTNWKTTQVKVAQVGADGKTNLSNVIYAPYGTPISGTYGSNVMPPQVSLVATLEVAGARGLAAKGRMYLPGIAHAIGTNGQIGNTQVLNMANKFKAFLDAVNVAASGDAGVILASQGRRVKNAQGDYEPVPGTAVNARVNRVRIGSVYDTQRRRRNALVEQYQSATLV